MEDNKFVLEVSDLQESRAQESQLQHIQSCRFLLRMVPSQAAQ